MRDDEIYPSLRTRGLQPMPAIAGMAAGGPYNDAWAAAAHATNPPGIITRPSPYFVFFVASWLEL